MEEHAKSAQGSVRGGGLSIRGACQAHLAQWGVRHEREEREERNAIVESPSFSKFTPLQSLLCSEPR